MSKQTELESKIQQIIQEKTTKIIPENIKSGVQIFDVVGTADIGENIIDVSNEPVSVSNTTLVFGDILPYTELEYIESTGTQYIDTTIKGEAFWEIKGQGTYAVQSSSSQVILGRRTQAGYWFGITSHTFYGFGANNETDILYSTLVTAYLTTTNSNITGTINDINIPTREISDTSYINNSYLLFNGNADDTTYCAKYKLFYAKCYQNNVPIRDFIPVKDENNVVCLYDKVSEQFFYNQGTGSFIAGPEI